MHICHAWYMMVCSSLYIAYLVIRAYKLQTENSDAIICIDGEAFAGPYLETQVHRGLGRIITLPAERSQPNKVSSS